MSHQTKHKKSGSPYCKRISAFFMFNNEHRAILLSQQIGKGASLCYNGFALFIASH